MGWRWIRPHTLTASFIPVLMGTALAFSRGVFDLWRFLAMFIASLLIQAGTNLINEYYDFRRGLDNADSKGIGGAIVHDQVPAHQVLRLALILFAVAIALGVYLASVTSVWLLVVGLAAMAVAYVYSAGPYPIAYTPFGEIVSGVLMGGLIVVLSFYIQVRQVSSGSLLLALPAILLVGSILMANNLRDLENDRAHGRHTLAIILGRNNAIRLFSSMLAAAYLIGMATWIWYFHTPWLFLALISIIWGTRAIAGFFASADPSGLVPAMKATALTNTVFGLGITLGLVAMHTIR